MSPADFSAWLDAMKRGDIDDEEIQLAWRAMQADVDLMGAEQSSPLGPIGAGIAWAAFWIALSMVLVALVVELTP